MGVVVDFEQVKNEAYAKEVVEELVLSDDDDFARFGEMLNDCLALVQSEDIVKMYAGLKVMKVVVDGLIDTIEEDEELSEEDINPDWFPSLKEK